MMLMPVFEFSILEGTPRETAAGVEARTGFDALPVEHAGCGPGRRLAGISKREFIEELGGGRSSGITLWRNNGRTWNLSKAIYLIFKFSINFIVMVNVHEFYRRSISSRTSFLLEKVFPMPKSNSAIAWRVSATNSARSVGCDWFVAWGLRFRVLLPFFFPWRRLDSLHMQSLNSFCESWFR